MPDGYLSTDPNAGTYLSSDPNAGTPMSDTSKPAPQGGVGDTVGRALSSFWEQVNPVTMVQSLGQAVTSPVETARGIGQAQGEEYAKAARAFQAGDYVTGARHGLAYLLPVLGPALSAQSDKMMAGDIAGGVGGTVGIAANLGAPELAAGAVKTVTNAPKAAAVLRKQAADRITDVIKPTVGRNKVQFGNMAADVAPAVAKEPGLLAFSREGLSSKVAEKLAEAEAGLDAASTARSTNQVFYTDVLAKQLEARLDKLRRGGVVTEPNKLRAAQIEKAISELRKMGPVASFDDIRGMRGDYDQIAKARYNPSITADYLAKTAESRGAADVTGVLRERLAQMDPNTAAANKDYALWRKVSDVIEAAEETDRVRPKVGRQIMTRFGTTTAGGLSGGALGAMLGYVLGPIADSIAAMSPTTKIATARAMTRLANALEAGQSGAAYTALREIAAKTGQTARLSEFVRSGGQAQQQPQGGGMLIPATAP